MSLRQLGQEIVIENEPASVKESLFCLSSIRGAEVLVRVNSYGLCLGWGNGVSSPLFSAPFCVIASEHVGSVAFSSH